MKNKKLIKMGFALVVSSFMLVACDDWTDPENVDFNASTPDLQNPELYARYTASLRAYKQSPHFMMFGRLMNVTGEKTSEKDYLRSLPDSLDVVTLVNADNFSAFDSEDMSQIQQEKGTKVLYGIDLTQRKSEFENKGDLIGLMTVYLDEVVKKVSEEEFSGISVIYEGDLGNGSDEEANAKVAALQQLLLQKLTPIAGKKANNGKILVLEGNPIFLPQANRADFDFYVINTTEEKNAYGVRLEVAYANEYANVPFEKIIVSANFSGKMTNQDNKEVNAIPLMASLVPQIGPIAGLDVIDIGADYYNANKNYQFTNEAIQLLNPSPVK